MNDQPPTAPPGCAPTNGYGRPDNLKLAKWLDDVHDQVRLSCDDQWPAIVAEQKPLIEQLMQKAKTTNQLAAVIPVIKDMPMQDPARLLLLAVAAEMIVRGHNDKSSDGSEPFAATHG